MCSKLCSQVLIYSLIGSFAIITLSLSLVVYLKEFDSDNIGLVSDIGHNWHASPLTKIDLQDEPCSLPKVPISFGKFQGIEKGCLERRSGKNGPCIRYNDQKVDPKDYHVYDGKYFCATPMKFNYLTLPNVSVGQCQQGFVKCGKLDLIGNVLCVKDEKDCPINEFVLKSDRDKIPKDFNYRQQSLNNMVLLTTNKNTNGEIITDFKLSSKDGPCLNSMYDNLPVRPYMFARNYNFWQCPKVNAIFVDPRYKKIGQWIKIKKIYTENNLLEQLIRVKDWLYPIYSVNLYTRNYIGIKNECKQKLNQQIGNKLNEWFTNLQGTTERFKYALQINLSNLICTCIGFGIAIGLIILMIFFCKNQAFSFSMTMIFVIVEIAQMVIACLFASLWMNMDGDFFVIEDGCLDTISQMQYSALIANLGNVKSIAISNAVFAFLNLVLGVLLCFVHCCCKGDNDSSNSDETIEERLERLKLEMEQKKY